MPTEPRFDDLDLTEEPATKSGGPPVMKPAWTVIHGCTGTCNHGCSMEC